MTDAVSCVTKAVELALKIKDAVDTVRQNRMDCAHIKRRVERVRHTLSLCEGNAELMESPAVREAVEALAEVLVEALELVTGCQEESKRLVHLLYRGEAVQAAEQGASGHL
jgi:L1 cell adhesion molecule like protein